MFATRAAAIASSECAVCAAPGLHAPTETHRYTTWAELYAEADRHTAAPPPLEVDGVIHSYTL